MCAACNTAEGMKHTASRAYRCSQYSDLAECTFHAMRCLACSSQVSFEFRYGTCGCFFPLATNTSANAESDLLIACSRRSTVAKPNKGVQSLTGTYLAKTAD